MVDGCQAAKPSREIKPPADFRQICQYKAKWTVEKWQSPKISSINTSQVLIGRCDKWTHFLEGERPAGWTGGSGSQCCPRAPPHCIASIFPCRALTWLGKRGAFNQSKPGRRQLLIMWTHLMQLWLCSGGSGLRTTGRGKLNHMNEGGLIYFSFFCCCYNRTSWFLLWQCTLNKQKKALASCKNQHYDKKNHTLEPALSSRRVDCTLHHYCKGSLSFETHQQT